MRVGFQVSLGCVLLGLLALPALALDVGDAAPGLSIAEWVQGGPIDLQKEIGNKITMVEFWATWCPPCKESVPRLNKLQVKYKDHLTIIGVTVPDTRGNSPAAVRRFVKDQGPEMTYAVALDDREKTTNAYMLAANALGIPHAFLVGKDGKIAWQGSPLDPELEDVVEGLVRGTFDPKIESEVNRRFQQLNYALNRGQWNVVAPGLAEILKIAPANETALRAIRRVYVEEMNQPEEFRKWAKGHIAAHSKNVPAMQVLAEVLLEVSDLTRRFPDVSLEAARAAYEASSSREASTVAVYAMALHQVGAADRALDLQKEALDLANGDERQMMQDLYAFYTSCKEVRAKIP